MVLRAVSFFFDLLRADVVVVVNGKVVCEGRRLLEVVQLLIGAELRNNYGRKKPWSVNSRAPWRPELGCAYVWLRSKDILEASTGRTLAEVWSPSDQPGWGSATRNFTRRDNTHNLNSFAVNHL